MAAPAFLPTPDFSENNILRVVSGLRPLRAPGVRLEVESILNRKIVHNYGHGGSGFTLAWGSAEEAADLVANLGLGSPETSGPIAIIGAGVIGLTTAQVLIERGYKVRLYYANISPNTTSDMAGAQWSPSFVNPGVTTKEKARYQRMLAATYRRYERLQGAHYGVFLRPNYIPEGSHDGLQDVPAGILKPTELLSRMPFAGVKTRGSLIYSWLIEPQTFLPAVISDLRRAGVHFIQREFRALSELKNLEEDMIVNCSGLGARTLFGDNELIAMKGQLVLLNPDTRMDYLALHRGYVFCRRDAIVLGGSYERNVYNTEINSAVTSKILRINREFFGI